MLVRQIPQSFGLLYFLDELVFTEAALLADADAQHLSPDFSSAIAQGEVLFSQERGARRNVICKEAEVSVHNTNLDVLSTRFTKLSGAVAPELLPKLLGNTPSAFVRQPLRIQCEKTRDIVVPALAKLPSDHQLFPFGPELATKSSQALGALDGRAQAKGSRDLLNNEVDEWKEAMNALRNMGFADLLKLEIAKKKGKGWSRAFFRVVSSGSSSGPSEDEAEAVVRE